jgi:hypothetical protein
MFLQFWDEMKVKWSEVWAVYWVVQDSETKAVNLCSH